MTKIKICGITQPEDILYIETYPIDYLGFIMYPKSPRYVGKNLRDLLKIPKKAKKVVVLVNPLYEEVKKVLELGADLIQLHGEETLEFAEKIGLERVIKAFRIKEKLTLEELEKWKRCYALLLDTYVEGLPGGTGITFNWKEAKIAVEAGYKIFLAGGLNPHNILSAIKTVNPYGIDLSSGLEKKLGKKDPHKIRELFTKLRGEKLSP